MPDVVSAVKAGSPLCARLNLKRGEAIRSGALRPFHAFPAMAGIALALPISLRTNAPRTKCTSDLHNPDGIPWSLRQESNSKAEHLNP
jgi:hypothetical protein